MSLVQSEIFTPLEWAIFKANNLSKADIERATRIKKRALEHQANLKKTSPINVEKLGKS